MAALVNGAAIVLPGNFMVAFAGGFPTRDTGFATQV